MGSKTIQKITSSKLQQLAILDHKSVWHRSSPEHPFIFDGGSNFSSHSTPKLQVAQPNPLSFQSLRDYNCLGGVHSCHQTHGKIIALTNGLLFKSLLFKYFKKQRFEFRDVWVALSRFRETQERKKLGQIDPVTGGASDIVKAESSGEDPRATGGLAAQGLRNCTLIGH